MPNNIREEKFKNYLIQVIAFIKITILNENPHTVKHVINQLLTAFSKNDKTEHKKLYINIKNFINNIDDTKDKNIAISKIDKYFNKNMIKIIRELLTN